jgi:hypothetical protein
LIPFTISPSLCTGRRRYADNVAEGTLELDAEELELTRRYAEPLREADYSAAVEQRQNAVFSIQQRVNQFVDSLHITTERLSKGHDRSLPFVDIPAPSARDRRNVSSIAREPNSAAASLQSAVAST